LFLSEEFSFHFGWVAKNEEIIARPELSLVQQLQSNKCIQCSFLMATYANRERRLTKQWNEIKSFLGFGSKYGLAMTSSPRRAFLNIS